MPPARAAPSRRITERVSPRVFRVVALPAPSDREKTQMFIQRYFEHFPAAGEVDHLRPQLVQPRRRRIRDGLLHRGGAQALSRAHPAVRATDRRSRDHAHQDLARGRPGGAGAAVCRAHRRSAAAVEAEPDGCRILRALVRLFAGARPDARGDRQQARALAHRALGRQEARAPQLHLPHPEPIPYKKVPHEKVKLPKRRTRASTTIRPACGARNFVAERY